MTEQIAAGHLAQRLELVSGKALDWAKQVLDMPIDPDSAPLLRAQGSAAMTILNAQLRADAQRLQAVRHDRALERLLEAIAAHEPLVPKSEGCSLTKASLAHAV